MSHNDLLIRLLKRLRGVSRADLEILRDELAVLRRDLAQLEHQTVTKAELANETFALRETTLAQRRVLLEAAHRPAPVGTPPLSPPIDVTLASSMRALGQRAPRAFALWQELLERNRGEYVELRPDSCSVAGHRLAAMFSGFIAPYLNGSILDVGCGPQALPLYLSGCDPERVAGIDPLAPANEHPFLFRQAVAEYIPWPDGAFDAAIAATSLDHVLLVDATLAEIARVLKQDGCFLVWVSFVPGAPPYEPLAQDLTPVDEFHLFHFDRPWFEEMLSEHFIINERFSFLEPQRSAFYALKNRSPVPPDRPVAGHGQPEAR
jgi:SAM-dependent methyltransferase